MWHRERKDIPSTDRCSLVWLILGAALLTFSNGSRIIPVAAWLFPVFIMRFLRTQKLVRGILLALPFFIISSLVLVWSWLDIEELAPALRVAAAIFMAVRTLLPFVADRLMVPRLDGFVSTLVFPTAWTTLEYLYSLSPEGTWGSLAYTQYGNLPLIQVVSITGIWGLTFLITWFASFVNWAWERDFSWMRVRAGAGLFSGIIVLLLIFGGARLAFFSPEAKTVCVASITKPRHLPLFFDLKGERSSIGKNAREEKEFFLEKSRLAARRGAKIVTWQEHAVFLYEEDEADFVERARGIAQREQVNIVMAYNTYPVGFPDQPWKNKLTGIDPSGNIRWAYLKSYPSMALEPGLPPGNREVPIMATREGNIACVICTDQEHPSLVRQAAKAGAFLLLVPSAGWKGVNPLHTHMAAFRAVENGLSLVKPNGRALSAAFDPQGRVLARLDYWNTDETVMMSHVPTKGVKTLYARIGDLFAWLCIVAFAGIGAAAIRKPSRPSSSLAHHENAEKGAQIF